MKSCPQCATAFEVSAADREFYKQVSPVFQGKKYLVPEPTLCPSCRMQRRMSWRNERKFYRRKCDLCQRSMLAMYAPEVPFPVYCSECWWSDKWDPLQYDREFDFSRSFFKQFDELQNEVPHFALAVLSSTMENSDFCNHAGYLKNCYLLVNSDESEQCLYGKGVNRCFDCVDCFKIYECQACYESSNCTNCSFSTFLTDSNNCSECHFSENLIGCKHCFGCVNLRNKEYYFYNQKLSPEEYQQKVAVELQKPYREIQAHFQEFRKQFPYKWMQEKNTEHCSGDYLVNCKDCTECYDCEFLENSQYCSDLKKGGKVSFGNQDISYFGMGIDNSYECSVGGYNANHTLFCENVWESADVYYSQVCTQSNHDLFGCVGLRHKQYCVFNRQYTKEEYETLAAKIIEHMEQTGEWGEFFPVSISPFGYNETTAIEYFPLSKSEARQKEMKWHEEKAPDFSDVTKKIPAEKLPQSIVQIPDDILNWAVECTESKRLFRIQKSELDFYRRMQLRIPEFHPDVRHAKRFALRNKRILQRRNCANCQQSIATTYDGAVANVYCEKCYLAALD